MTPATDIVLTAHRATPNGRTLIVDDLDVSGDGIGHLSSSGTAPADLWLQPSGSPSLHLAVLSAPRSARELFRVLVLLERLIAPGGRILILPYVTEDGPENRFEATECFMGVYPGWERQPIANVIELRKEPIRIPPTEEDRLPLAQGGDEWQRVEFTPPPIKKRVISLAVWGDATYYQYLPAYVRAHLALFPNYELRIHHDETIFRAGYGGTLHGLQRRGLAKLVYVPSRPGQGKCERMLHRLCPAWDPEVEYLFARDLDSLPTWRERCAVEEFLSSADRGETNAHVIHDNVAHCGLMGGLSGFRTEALRTLAPTFAEFIALAGFSDERWAQHGADQDFLNSVISGQMRIFEHSVFRWFDEDGVTRRYRNPSEWAGGTRSVRFVTDIAAFEDAVVPSSVREPSNGLIAYMGVAGHDHHKATAFYEEHCPAIGEIRAAEEVAGERPGMVGGDEPRVVLSSDTDPMYAFFVPLTCLLWRRRGYRPLLLLAGSPEFWTTHPRHHLSLEAAREVGAEIHFIAIPNSSVSSRTVAQVVRLFAFAVPGIRGDDYLLTSDIDLFPLGPWVGGRRDPEKAFQVYGMDAAALSQSPVHFPIAYLGARGEVWRQIMGTGTLQALMESALTEFARVSQDAADGWYGDPWYFDERLFGERLQAWPGYPDACQMIPRSFGPGEERIDRGAWRMPQSLDGVADAHLPRPGFTEANWNLIRPILSLALPEPWQKWAEAYREAWLVHEVTP